MEFGLTSVASYWHLHLPQGQASAYKSSSIDHGLSADAIEASAVLQEDSRPQAILKLRPPNSLEYSTRYGCQPKGLNSSSIDLQNMSLAKTCAYLLAVP